jgi:hypothetical protein
LGTYINMLQIVQELDKLRMSTQSTEFKNAT